MSTRRLFLLSGATLALGACSTAQIAQSTRGHYAGPAVHTVAIAPGGGALADAIGVELFNRGVSVVDAEQTRGILGHVGISEVQVATPQSYAALHAAGADALLVVKSVMSSDGTPESASARLTSTVNGEVVAGLTWQNGWGGMRGSIADRTMRKNLAETASAISDTLLQRMR